MPVSDVDVINGALLQLGAQTISAIGEDSVAGELSAATYETIRDRVLASHPWGFATKRVQLTELSPVPATGTGFDRRFQLPTDYLRVLELIDARDEDWVIEDQELLTSFVDDVFVKYIRRVETPGKFSAPFVEALQSILASEWAEPLTSSNSLSNRMDRAAEVRMRRSRSFDGQESAMQIVEHYSWIQKR
jgi:hypothetical protein